MNPKVDAYIKRSDNWPSEMTRLRPVLLKCGLTEEIKWGKPCYSRLINGSDSKIAIMQEMKNFLALMFFKGELIDDPDGVLEAQGPNTRSAKRICFRSVDDVDRLAPTVEAYVKQAIRNEEAGLEVGPAPNPVFVEELTKRLDQDEQFRIAFESLTPGRQREYNIYLSGAKQAKTRKARLEKYAPKILEGKGFRDR